jgi:hypothetical protein
MSQDGPACEAASNVAWRFRDSLQLSDRDVIGEIFSGTNVAPITRVWNRENAKRHPRGVHGRSRCAIAMALGCISKRSEIGDN